MWHQYYVQTLLHLYGIVIQMQIVVSQLSDVTSLCNRDVIALGKGAASDVIINFVKLETKLPNLHL